MSKHTKLGTVFKLELVRVSLKKSRSSHVCSLCLLALFHRSLPVQEWKKISQAGHVGMHVSLQKNRS